MYFFYRSKRPFVVAQIETVSALNEIDEIVKIPGLDSLIVGPYDLSGSMGIPGQVHDPQILSAIKTVVEKSRAAGIFVGMGMGANKSHALEAAKLGVNWAQCGNDYEFLIRTAEHLFTDIRQQLD